MERAGERDDGAGGLRGAGGELADRDDAGVGIELRAGRGSERDEHGTSRDHESSHRVLSLPARA